MTTTRATTRPAARKVERMSGRTDRRGATVDRAHGELAAHLTARDRWCVRMLAEHRVLTTAHLTQLAFAHPRRARRRLQILRELGAIDAFQPLHGTGVASRRGGGSAPLHWVAPPLAYAMLAAEDGHDLAPQADSRQVGRGVALAHNAQLGHQLAVNTLLVDLATAPSPTSRVESRAESRAEAWVGGGGGLVCWWGQARCTQHLAPARPDAYAVWTTPTPDPGPRGTRVGFAVEWDTGTEPLTRLAAKLRGYHRLALASAIVTPVVIWLPGPRREHNAQAVLAAALADLDHPHLVPVFTTYSDPPRIPSRGTGRAASVPGGAGTGRTARSGPQWDPDARILLPVSAGAAAAGASGSARVSLDDLTHTHTERGLTHAELHEPRPTYPGHDPYGADTLDPDTLDPDTDPLDAGPLGPDFLGADGHHDAASGAGPGQLNATAWRTRPTQMWRSPHPTPPPAR